MEIHFSALLLAGGESKRMGTDKALVEWNHKPLWRHQWEKLEAIGAGEILLSRRQDQPLKGYEGPLVIDRFSEGGPLSGILAGLEIAQYSRVLVLAIDLPLLTSEQLGRLIQESSGETGAVYRSKWGMEPLAAVYLKGFKEEVRLALERNERSMQPLIAGWVRERRMKELAVPAGRESEWLNFNTPLKT